VWVVCVLLLSLLYICCAYVYVCIAGIRGEVAAVMIVAVFEPMGFITGVGGFTIRSSVAKKLTLHYTLLL